MPKAAKGSSPLPSLPQAPRAKPIPRRPNPSRPLHKNHNHENRPRLRARICHRRTGRAYARGQGGYAGAVEGYA